MGKKLSISLAILWFAVLTSSFYFLAQYKSEAGANADAPTQLPAEIAERIAHNQPTLIAIFHPKCACSMASARELERLLSKVKHPVNVFAIFYEPSDHNFDWKETELKSYVEDMPNVKMIHDRDGQLAQELAVETSGQVLLYGADGHLQFRGGITPSRGHEGDSVAKDSLLAWINQGASEVATSHVFGCHMFSSHKSTSSRKISP